MKQEAMLAAMSPEGELAQIEQTLAQLGAEREDQRLQYASLITAAHRPNAQVSERECRAAHADLAALDARIATVRARRAELAEAVRGPVVTAKRLIDVPMPKRLIAAQQRLDAARLARTEALANVQAATSAAASKRAQQALADSEEEIFAARRERAAELVPYDRAIAIALQPIVSTAAEAICAAAEQLLAAHATLIEAASYSRPDVSGGQAAATTMNVAAIQQAGAIAEGILRVVGPAQGR